MTQPPDKVRPLKAPPSRRAGVHIPAAILGAIDGAILLVQGRPIYVALPFALLLGFFVAYFLSRKHRSLTERYRRENGLPDEDGNTPAPRGGWANPTGGQKLAKRFARSSSELSKRRPR
jgi:uncharacterized membrane protein YfcA